MLEEKRIPDAEGWWCRRHDGRLKWFRVDMASTTGAPPFTPHVYLSDLFNMVPVKQLSRVGTRMVRPGGRTW
jgi:hypothetical protein